MRKPTYTPWQQLAVVSVPDNKEFSFEYLATYGIVEEQQALGMSDKAYWSFCKKLMRSMVKQRLCAVAVDNSLSTWYKLTPEGQQLRQHLLGSISPTP